MLSLGDDKNQGIILRWREGRTEVWGQTFLDEERSVWTGTGEKPDKRKGPKFHFISDSEIKNYELCTRNQRLI